MPQADLDAEHRGLAAEAHGADAEFVYLLMELILQIKNIMTHVVGYVKVKKLLKLV